LMTRHDLWHEDENKKSKQSLYYIEVVGAGIPFFHEYSIGLSTPIERSAMQIAIDTFKNNPYLVGKSSNGHGKYQTNNWYEDLDSSPSLFIEFLEQNRDVLVEYLHLWNRPEQLVRPSKGKETIEFPKDLTSELNRLVRERESSIQSVFHKHMKSCR